MKYLFFIILFISPLVRANPILAIEDSVGYGDFIGRIESGEKCSVEVNKASDKIRIFLFNPRINRIDVSRDDHVEYTNQVLRIRTAVIEENNSKITNTLVISDAMIGIEREFCTFKCWISMTPCFLDD